NMIGERLAELRKDKGLSQKDLANELKISTYTVSSYERDNSDPDDEMKIKIASFFNISLDYLLGLINEERPIGGGSPLIVPEGLPPQAIKEIKDYIEYIKTKYQGD
ncbi:MAG: helix-turn-helix transcriptional regulator, partial [Ethanoligenens sp.]